MMIDRGLSRAWTGGQGAGAGAGAKYCLELRQVGQAASEECRAQQGPGRAGRPASTLCRPAFPGADPAPSRGGSTLRPAPCCPAVAPLPQVADVCVDALVEPAASNKVVEIIAKQDTPRRPTTELFAAV